MSATFRTACLTALTAGLLMGAGSGCQLISSREAQPEWKQTVRGELAGNLNADHWQPRLDWSPTREWESRETNRPAAGSSRWRYASPAWRETLANWEDRLDMRTDFAATDLDREDLLAELAQADNLRGWNAAILLAQLNPARARELAPLLARLTTKPPRYVLPPMEPLPEKAPEPKSLADRVATLLTKPVARPLESRQISLAMQAAAAEAWCLVLSSRQRDPIEALAPAGLALVEFELPDEVRGELFRGIGRWVPPANVPGLDQALPKTRGSHPNSPQLRQAAVEACVLYALWNRDAMDLDHEKNVSGKALAAGATSRTPSEPVASAIPLSSRNVSGKALTAGAMSRTPSEPVASAIPLNSLSNDSNATPPNPWPATLLDWQWEPDAYFEPDSLIRRRFAHWLVLTRHPNAGKVLESHLTDQDFAVRDDALVHLGGLKTPQALETLQKHARRPEPRVRAMAVKGLAHWGVSYLQPFLEDPSHEVRLSLAEELGRFPTREAAIQLQVLQADASRQVESAALESTGCWPDPLAIPVLLHGMEHASIPTRRECFRELRRRTRLKETYPITAGPDVRQEAIGQLVRNWNLPTQLEFAQVALPLNAKVNRLRVDELRMYLEDVINPEFPENSARHQAAISALKESAAEDVPAIETFVLEQPATPRTDVILQEVLPALSPAHAAIQKMQSPEVSQRRAAVNELRSLAERQSLSPLAVRRLGIAIKTETDGLVWRSALHAILPDDNAKTSQIFTWAANHPDGGIRQLACEFAARHQRPAFADWLLPLLHDSQSAVKLAAIEAAGRCGNRIVIEGIPDSNQAESLPGLKSLLADPDSRVSVASAIAMSRLGDPSGHDELLRLSQHADERIRLQVIAEMGASRQTRFVEALIGIGWTARSDQVKREVLKSLGKLIPLENQPPALTNTTGVDDKIKLWAEWWEKNQRVP